MRDVLDLADAVADRRSINPEASVRRGHRSPAYEVGLIAFHPRTDDDPRQIEHADRDVLCQVLRGLGCLCIADEQLPVTPGAIYRIPARTPHDFAAATAAPLVLLYTLAAAAPT